MKLGELIKQLQIIAKKHHENLEVTTEICDEFNPMSKVVTVDKLGCDVNHYQGKAYGVHIT